MGSKLSKLIDTVRDYAKQACEALLSVRFCVANMATNHLKGLGNVFTEVDLEKWSTLVKRKNLFTGEVQAFAEATATKLRIVKGRTEDVHYSSLQECYRGFDKEETLEKVTELQKQCISLKADFEAFRLHLENDYPPTKVKRISEFLLCAGGFLCAAVAIALHLIPGVAFILEPVLIAGCAIGAAVMAISAGALCFSKSEVEKAITFIENIEDRLRTIKDSMSTVRASTEAITMAERKECAGLIQKIITGCDKVVEACQSV